jgi:hypothetical protein
MDCPCCASVRRVFNLSQVEVVGTVCQVCTKYGIPDFMASNPTKEQFVEYIKEWTAYSTLATSAGQEERMQ